PPAHGCPHSFPTRRSSDLASLPAQLASESLFSVDAGLEFHAQVLARFAVHELKLKHIAHLTHNRYRAAAGLASSFTKEMAQFARSEEHTSELQSRSELVCR